MVEKYETNERPEFERRKENIAEKQRIANQSTGQTTVNPFTGSASKTIDEEAKQKKDAELAQEIEKLKREESVRTNQELPKLREQLRQIQQNQQQEARQSNSESGQDENHSQGQGMVL